MKAYTKLTVVMWCHILIGSLKQPLAAIFASNHHRGRPVDKIRSIKEEKNLSKFLVRKLTHRMTNFGTRLTKGIFYICGEAGEAGRGFTTKNLSPIYWFS